MNRKGTSMATTNPYSDHEVLEIFIETVDELQTSEFARQVKKGVRVGLLAGQGVVISQCVGPEREAVKAFLLTLRFFGQDNDVTSLRNMAARVATLNVVQDLKDEFSRSRDNFNDFLDGPLHIPVPGAGADTKRDVFDAFLYGIYAHANPDKRKKVKGWEQMPYYGDLEAQFYVIATHFMVAATAMAASCKKMLATGAV
jgi:hypothetical protein